MFEPPEIDLGELEACLLEDTPELAIAVIGGFDETEKEMVAI